MAVQDTFRTYDGDGFTTDYAIPFTYELPVEVKITKDGVIITDWTFVNPSVLRLSSPLLIGSTLTVERVTNIDSPAVVWKNGSGTTGGQLNAMVRQLINSMQEARDTALRGLFRKPTGEYDFANAKASNLGDPAAANDAATKGYVDGVVGGAASSALAAAASAATASTKAAEADADAATATAASTKAQAWADSDANVQVESGKYSAKHWAALAQAIASGGNATTLPFTPAGNISATNVQSAIQELDTEKAAAGHDHDSRYYTETEMNTFLAAKQASLGFTPVQQGGGTGQLTNKVYIGWSGSALTATVDAVNLGTFSFSGHTHDDRYYTEAEINSSFATFAWVQGNYYTAASVNSIVGGYMPLGGGTFSGGLSQNCSISGAAFNCNNFGPAGYGFLSLLTAGDCNNNFIGRINRGQNATDYFVTMVSDYNGSKDTEWKVRHDGATISDAAYSSAGADYAEYYEWSDGNPSNEDRRGWTVVLANNGKIRRATASDPASTILGVVSVRPIVVGDAEPLRWKGQFLMDQWGDYQREIVTRAYWSVTAHDGTVTHHVERVDAPKTPIPANAQMVIEQLRVLNPEYDPDIPYVTREERPEWSPIGLVGKLRVLKGEPVGDRWIKIRDLTPSIEQWQVR